jgi:hypothetical protein
MKVFRAAVWVGRLGSLILLSVCGCQQSRPTPAAIESNGQAQFRWLDNGRDSALWNRVQTAFGQELEPDDPRKVPEHYSPIQYKYIYQIGVFRDAALVILGYKDTKDSPGDAFFNAYSFNLREGSKRAIAAEPPQPPTVYPQADVLWEFNVVRLAQFDGSPTPDVVFTYASCTECEEERLLASFEYEPSGGWTARQWNKVSGLRDESSLLLMATPTPDDNAVSADYLFKIKDWNGDGFDDVAVRRREVTQVSKRKQDTDDSTTIYKAEKGVLVGHEITNSTERERINAGLCSDSKLTFCKRSK